MLARAPLLARRRAALVPLLVLAGAPAAAPAAVASGLDEAAYLSLADRLQVHLDAIWDTSLEHYDPGPGATTTQVNADMLVVHSVAALHGHTGPARNDKRARLVARFLTGPAIWTERPLPGAEPHIRGPGWRAAPTHPRQHVVFGTEAAEGLAHAYLAREQIGLDAGTVAAIRDELARAAASPDFAWPALRLNQHNWYCSIYAANAAVNGASAQLADGMRRHVARFTAAARERDGRAGNLGGGLRFHYMPHRAWGARGNLDSAEYANIVLGFSRFYAQARRAGMPPPGRLGLLRQWVRRALAGYWTHAGYLNWDTGLGFKRWHQRKKVPLAQAALIGIATAPQLQPDPRWGAWAKWLLDRGLQHYADLVERTGAIPDSLAYGVNVYPQSRGTIYLTAARYAANAARALQAGLGRLPANQPPPLFAFDPETGRLAVTTPAYNTAILAVNRSALPYGGIDIARLFDARQEVAAGIGGSSPATFGLRVRSRAGRVLLETQYGARSARRPSPLRLTRAPSGVGAQRTPARLRAYAGPFSDLRATGTVTARGLRATSGYRFTAAAIEGRWSVGGSRAAHTASTVGFPSWGRAARVSAVLLKGRSVAVGRRPVALSRVRELQLAGAASGYRVLPLSRPAGAYVRTRWTRPHDSAPDPGPTLEILLRGSSTFAARIVVDREVSSPARSYGT